MKIFGQICAAFCLLGVLASNSFAIADAGGPAIGDIPPPLTLSKTIQGPPAAQISWDKLKGKVVVLEFWATWCGPCIRAIPHLNHLAEQFKSKPIVFISVSDENEDVVRRFLKNHPMNSRVALDDYDVLNKAFHVAAIPHAVIVDATGHIAAIANPVSIKPENLEEVLAGEKCSLPPPAVYTISRFSNEVVPNEAPPLFEISIREHKMPQRFEGPVCMWSSIPSGCGFEGKISTVESALDFLFHKSPARTIVKCKLPDGFYDFELRAPPGQVTELKDQFIAALHTVFGLEVKQTVKMMDAYIMTQISTNAPGLSEVETPGGGGSMRAGFRFHGSNMKTVTEYLELALGKPVVDKTALKSLFNVTVKWKMSKAEQRGESTPDPKAVIAGAREQLGLQLKLKRQPIEVLEVSEVAQ